MILNTWEDRTNYLERMQNYLVSKFGSDHYNVFFFGSILRDDYKPGKSDIDVAVYADNYALELDVCIALETFFKETEMDNSILQISTTQKNAFVILSPLSLNVSVTDFYPEELVNYRRQLARRWFWYNEDKKMFTARRSDEQKELVK